MHDAWYDAWPYPRPYPRLANPAQASRQVAAFPPRATLLKLACSGCNGAGGHGRVSPMPLSHSNEKNVSGMALTGPIKCSQCSEAELLEARRERMGASAWRLQARPVHVELHRRQNCAQQRVQSPAQLPCSSTGRRSAWRGSRAAAKLCGTAAAAGPACGMAMR